MDGGGRWCSSALPDGTAHSGVEITGGHYCTLNIVCVCVCVCVHTLGVGILPNTTLHPKGILHKLDQTRPTNRMENTGRFWILRTGLRRLDRDVLLIVRQSFYFACLFSKKRVENLCRKTFLFGQPRDEVVASHQTSQSQHKYLVSTPSGKTDPSDRNKRSQACERSKKQYSPI